MFCSCDIYKFGLKVHSLFIRLVVVGAFTTHVVSFNWFNISKAGRYKSGHLSSGFANVGENLSIYIKWCIWRF